LHRMANKSVNKKYPLELMEMFRFKPVTIDMKKLHPLFLLHLLQFLSDGSTVRSKFGK